MRGQWWPVDRTFPFIADGVTKPIGGRTILAVNGEPVALVGPHGQSYESVD